jgi:hypothetical protein
VILDILVPFSRYSNDSPSECCLNVISPSGISGHTCSRVVIYVRGDKKLVGCLLRDTHLLMRWPQHHPKPVFFGGGGL